jgi:hypothetical protein
MARARMIQASTGMVWKPYPKKWHMASRRSKVMHGRL